MLCWGENSPCSRYSMWIPFFLSETLNTQNFHKPFPAHWQNTPVSCPTSLPWVHPRAPQERAQRGCCSTQLSQMFCILGIPGVAPGAVLAVPRTHQGSALSQTRLVCDICHLFSATATAQEQESSQEFCTEGMKLSSGPGCPSPSGATSTNVVPIKDFQHRPSFNPTLQSRAHGRKS